MEESELETGGSELVSEFREEVESVLSLFEKQFRRVAREWGEAGRESPHMLARIAEGTKDQLSLALHGLVSDLRALERGRQERGGQSSAEMQTQGTVSEVRVETEGQGTERGERKRALTQSLETDVREEDIESESESESGGKGEKEESKGIRAVTNEELSMKNGEWKCEQCGKVLCRKESLRNHINAVHRKLKPFACSHFGCGRAFAQKRDLRRHSRIHTGERPFHCSHCAKRFRDSSHLKKHIRTHTGDRPYVCRHPLCDQAFRDTSARKRHEHNTHPTLQL